MLLIVFTNCYFFGLFLILLDFVLFVVQRDLHESQVSRKCRKCFIGGARHNKEEVLS